MTLQPPLGTMTMRGTGKSTMSVLEVGQPPLGTKTMSAVCDTGKSSMSTHGKGQPPLRTKTMSAGSDTGKSSVDYSDTSTSPLQAAPFHLTAVSASDMELLLKRSDAAIAGVGLQPCKRAPFLSLLSRFHCRPREVFLRSKQSTTPAFEGHDSRLFSKLLHTSRGSGSRMLL